MTRQAFPPEPPKLADSLPEGARVVEVYAIYRTESVGMSTRRGALKRYTTDKAEAKREGANWCEVDTREAIEIGGRLYVLDPEAPRPLKVTRG